MSTTNAVSAGDQDFSTPRPDGFGRPQGPPDVRFAADDEFKEIVAHIFSKMAPPWLGPDRRPLPRIQRDVITERSYLRDWRDQFRRAETSPTGYPLIDKTFLDAIDARVRESHEAAGPLG